MNRTRRGTALVAVSVIALVGAIAAPAFAASNRQIAKASTLKVSDLTETGWKAKPHTEGHFCSIYHFWPSGVGVRLCTGKTKKPNGLFMAGRRGQC